MTDLPPQNPLETLLKSAMDGQTSIGGFMKAFVASEVILLNGSLVTTDGSGFDPLLFDDGGVKRVAVFTDLCRLGGYSQTAPHVGQMRMIEVLGRIPGGFGVVVNPATPLQLTISPDGVGHLLEDFADPFRP